IRLDSGVPDNELPFILSELRADSDCGLLPLLMIATPGQQAEVTRIAERTRNTYMLPDAYATKGPELKRAVEDAIKFAAAPETVQKAPEEQQQWLKYELRRSKGQMLSAGERQRLDRESLDWFAQMARGELPGYDLKNAKDALLVALNNKDTATQALHILGRFPTQESQQRLAGVLLDKDRAELHVVAAKEL